MIVADTRAQVYEAENKLSEHEIYGCLYGHHRTYTLGAPPECGGSEEGCSGSEGETLAGKVVAYEEFSTKPCCQSVLVVVRDLGTGRTLHRVPTGSSTSPADVGRGFTSGIAVKSDGAVAWIVTSGVARGGNQVQVVDKSGSRVVASGTDVDPQSLALAGSTLYWTQGGKPFFTTLH
jgi:hypothetical protein